MKKKYIIIMIGICLILLVVIFANTGTETDITLGQYMDIEVEVTEKIVTDSDVENALIDAMVANKEDIEIKNRSVRNGDIVNIDYSGKVDGIQFDGGTTTEYDLEIGSGSFIEGFEDQIIGMKIGQTDDIKVTFPDPYYNDEELSGAEVVFTVKVNSITGKEIPSMVTDAMIKEISATYTTVKEYREFIRSGLEEEAKEINNQRKQEAIWKIVVENAKVNSLSSKKIKYYSNVFDSNYQYYADMYGVSLTELIESYMGITQDKFNLEKRNYVEGSTKTYAIAEIIAKEQGISISDEEYQSFLEENDINSDDKKKYGESIRDDLLYQKVIEFIISKSYITIIK